MTHPLFYIPQIDMWNWDRISRTFVSFQLKRAQESWRQTESALMSLDDDVDKIEQEIRGIWAVANVQLMRGFQARLTEIRKERKRITYVRHKLGPIIDTMIKRMEHWEAESAQTV